MNGIKVDDNGRVISVRYNISDEDTEWIHVGDIPPSPTNDLMSGEPSNEELENISSYILYYTGGELQWVEESELLKAYIRKRSFKLD